MSSNKEKNTWLTVDHQFEVFSDIDEPHFGFTVSHTGNEYNRCGICVRTTSRISPEEVHQVIQISNSKDSDVGQIVLWETGIEALVASISSDPSITSFGEPFTISTRNGESLSSVFAGLSDQYLISAIVEVTGCDMKSQS